MKTVYTNFNTVKKMLLLLIGLCCSLCVFAESTVSVQVIPENPIAGQRAMLRIQLNNTDQLPETPLSLPELPGQIRWYSNQISSGTSSSFRQINRKTERTSSVFLQIPFMPLKTGKCTLPSFKLEFNSGKTLQTDPLNLEFVKAPELPSGNDLIADKQQKPQLYYFSARLKNNKNTYFVGENISLDLYLQVYRNFEPRLDDFSLESSGNIPIQLIKKENQSVWGVNSYTQNINNIPYICYVFRCDVKAMSAGKLDIKPRLYLTLLEDSF